VIASSPIVTMAHVWPVSESVEHSATITPGRHRSRTARNAADSRIPDTVSRD
jgi:hypothetical protein